ncbi:MAG: DUF2891 domain-containing protein [Burkholderiaceae bacterium]
MIDREFAAALANTALKNVVTEYPYKLDPILACDGDVRPPRLVHPCFHGSYDWHSSVHMHWSLVRLLRLFPGHSQTDGTRDHLDQRLTTVHVGGELATLARPHQASFERPYGWGWLLKLAAELHLLADEQPAARNWRDAVAPLAQLFADRLIDYLPRAAYPIRSGAHGNSAFALLMALDYCAALQHRALQRAISERANRWFGRDRRYPAQYEPSGEDFLSGGLLEAVLMRRVVDGCSFADWWWQFAPDRDAMAHWLQPVPVSDPHDPKIVHLHGLNLSRAWCWQQLLPDLPAELQPLIAQAIEQHLAASTRASTDGNYVGTHWLASFVLMAETESATALSVDAPPS